jgi:hypothetical protein
MLNGVSWTMTVHRNSFFSFVGRQCAIQRLPPVELRGTPGLLLNHVLKTAKDKTGVK